MMNTLLKALLVSLISFSTFAEEIKVCIISSDVDSEKTDLYIDIKNSGEIDGVRLYKTISSGAVVADDSYPAETVMSEGIVAAERSGRDILILKAENFSKAVGGLVKLDYLYNGIKNIRRVVKFRLTKINRKWALTTLEGAKINRLFFVGNRAPVLGVIGIKEIKHSYVD